MYSKDRRTDVVVPYSNYNRTFTFFYDEFKNLCIEIGQTDRLDYIISKISAFIYEFDYSLPNQETLDLFRSKLNQLRSDFDADKDLKDLMVKDLSEFKNWVQYAKTYYVHYLKYIQLIGEFAEALSSTFMPNTNIQKKLLIYFNSEGFYENFASYKKMILQNLGSFKLHNFRKHFDAFLAYYSAYLLFVNTDDRIRVEELLSLTLAKVLSDDVVKVLSRYPELTKQQWHDFYVLEGVLHENILICNSIINCSFSNYGVLPKVNEKVYVDKTLI